MDGRVRVDVGFDGQLGDSTARSRAVPIDTRCTTASPGGSPVPVATSTCGSSWPTDTARAWVTQPVSPAGGPARGRSARAARGVAEQARGGLQIPGRRRRQRESLELSVGSGRSRRLFPAARKLDEAGHVADAVAQALGPAEIAARPAPRSPAPASAHAGTRSHAEEVEAPAAAGSWPTRSSVARHLVDAADLLEQLRLAEARELRTEVVARLVRRAEAKTRRSPVPRPTAFVSPSTCVRVSCVFL